MDGEFDDDLDDDYPDDEEEESTIPCPYCKREIHEDSRRCPYCEQYISEEDAPEAPKPWWIVAGVILCLLLLLGWVVG